MTTETERRVPEHPGWRPGHPGWRPGHPAQMHERLRTVEYDGQRVYLYDLSRFPLRLDNWVGRYGVLAVYRGFEIDTFSSDDLAEAEAAFELACERLREGG